MVQKLDFQHNNLLNNKKYPLINQMNNIKVIAFDADDTLWINEPYYQEVEEKFQKLLKDYLPANEVSKELLKIEIQNINLYGFGAKGFMLSMIETAINVSNNKIPTQKIKEIISLGKSLINKPIELLDNVEKTLISLKKDYKIILATKGDLLDQERKLHKSKLSQYFDNIEVMSDKKEANYTYLLNRLNIKPEEFLMIGNSVKSDILPVISIGGKAIHIPFSVTWKHEILEETNHNKAYKTISDLSEIISLLNNSEK